MNNLISPENKMASQSRSDNHFVWIASLIIVRLSNPLLVEFVCHEVLHHFLTNTTTSTLIIIIYRHHNLKNSHIFPWGLIKNKEIIFKYRFWDGFTGILRGEPEEPFYEVLPEKMPRSWRTEYKRINMSHRRKRARERNYYARNTLERKSVCIFFFFWRSLSLFIVIKNSVWWEKNLLEHMPVEIFLTTTSFKIVFIPSQWIETVPQSPLLYR